jgi:hypothetical protein
MLLPPLLPLLLPPLLLPPLLLPPLLVASDITPKFVVVKVHFT